MKTLFLIQIFILLCISNATSMENQKVEDWFDSSEFTGLEILRTKAGTAKPTHQSEIKDPIIIKNIANNIKRISPNGDMMMKLLIDETILLIFKQKEKTTKIHIYDGHLQTPTTGFNSSEKDKFLEIKLYTQIKQILK